MVSGMQTLRAVLAAGFVITVTSAAAAFSMPGNRSMMLATPRGGPLLVPVAFDVKAELARAAEKKCGHEMAEIPAAAVDPRSSADRRGV